MSDILRTIQEQAQHIGCLQPLTQRGYSKPTKAMDRLDKLLSAPNLLSWLDQSSFDFKYSNREFILKLGKVLNIAKPELIAAITAGQNEQVRLEQMFQPTIFIDTNFKRKGQPIFALALLEERRHIALGKRDVLNDATAELERIKCIVRHHYKKSGGKLEIWGEIHRYIYVYADGQQLAISPLGEVTEDECPIQRATLTIKGKDVSSVLMPNYYLSAQISRASFCRIVRVYY